MHLEASLAKMVRYFTIHKSEEGLYKEKGSRFLSFAIPVTDEKEIQDQLTRLRKTYFDARHHCYAYRLGMKNQAIRANDDGEPNHSAGDPILGQIRSFDLTNVLVVVVRYFGGVKLGVGGLIQAYREAAADALDKVDKVEIFEKVSFSIRFRYDQTTLVERILSDFKIEYQERMYTEVCLLRCEVRESEAGDLFERLELGGVGFTISD